jgi:hypothetical protein
VQFETESRTRLHRPSPIALASATAATPQSYEAATDQSRHEAWRHPDMEQSLHLHEIRVQAHVPYRALTRDSAEGDRVSNMRTEVREFERKAKGCPQREPHSEVGHWREDPVTPRGAGQHLGASLGLANEGRLEQKGRDYDQAETAT